MCGVVEHTKPKPGPLEETLEVKVETLKVSVQNGEYIIGGQL